MNERLTKCAVIRAHERVRVLHKHSPFQMRHIHTYVHIWIRRDCDKCNWSVVRYIAFILPVPFLARHKRCTPKTPHYVAYYYTQPKPYDASMQCGFFIHFIAFNGSVCWRPHTRPPRFPIFVHRTVHACVRAYVISIIQLSNVLVRAQSLSLPFDATCLVRWTLMQAWTHTRTLLYRHRHALYFTHTNTHWICALFGSESFLAFFFPFRSLFQWVNINF